jgi:hypothetical protein
MKIVDGLFIYLSAVLIEMPTVFQTCAEARFCCEPQSLQSGRKIKLLSCLDGLTFLDTNLIVL